MSAYSVFTWPFRLSYNHSKEKNNTEGDYPADLEPKIKSFIKKFIPGESIVFFYLNYDNPISGEENKYALVGCAKISDIKYPESFTFTADHLAEMRRGQGMQHFPTLNWAIRITHDFPNTGILLPYHEFLQYIEEHPEEEEKLNEIRVLIEEESLISDFKYVSEEIDDDACIYLLYKLRKSLKKIQEYGDKIADVSVPLKRIENYLAEAWQKRGLFPGLEAVVDFLADPESDEPEDGKDLVRHVRSQSDDGLLEKIFSLLTDNKPVPPDLSRFNQFILKTRRRARNRTALLSVLKKLSLFHLNKYQLRRILFPDSVEAHPFGSKSISPEDIERNPYLLCENYQRAARNENLRNKELDRLDYRDKPIDLFRIDIGMFPDEDYITPDFEIQDLEPLDPQRIRAIILEYLFDAESNGHCFVSLEDIHSFVIEHPLFYKKVQDNKLLINKEQLVSESHKDHYRHRLHIEDEGVFFYLQETRKAEQCVEQVVKELLRRNEITSDTSWIAPTIQQESASLKQNIPQFDEASFIEERKQLFNNIFKRSFFILTGKPGSGKTRALRTIIRQLMDNKESVIALAPTGKAALRMQNETNFPNAKTIDKFLSECRLRYCMEDFSQFSSIQRRPETPLIKNLIIDESSMVNLHHMAILFRLLELQGLGSINRIILVGDENQLPPIGCGRPFYDIGEFIRQHPLRRDTHFIRLTTNCRQKSDEQILRAAEVFAGKNRYYQNILDDVMKGGQVSPMMEVLKWKDNDELQAQIDHKLQDLITEQTGEKDKQKGFNLLFGMYDNGFVKKSNSKSLKIDNFQMITPYRVRLGSEMLNQFIREKYKNSWWPEKSFDSSFAHSEKIIRVQNWYRGQNLVLSNGSIGVICNHKKTGKRYLYFPDTDYRINWKDVNKNDQELFDAAYAITIHKSQGSDFEHVFVIIPERRAMLSRELIYTAFTRSKGPLTVFVQQTEQDNPLEIARNRSDVLIRNTSLFTSPEDAKRIFQPDLGVKVKSKIEYIIYSALKIAEDEGLLTFYYENPITLDFDGKPVEVKPDFTITINERTYYWEHLGMLDQKDYSRDWQERKTAYKNTGLADFLITTDDLNGVEDEILRNIIDDMVNDNIQESKDTAFSDHHYLLYSE